MAPYKLAYPDHDPVLSVGSAESEEREKKDEKKNVEEQPKPSP